MDKLHLIQKLIRFNLGGFYIEMAFVSLNRTDGLVDSGDEVIYIINLVFEGFVIEGNHLPAVGPAGRQPTSTRARFGVLTEGML